MTFGKPTRNIVTTKIRNGSLEHADYPIFVIKSQLIGKLVQINSEAYMTYACGRNTGDKTET